MSGFQHDNWAPSLVNDLRPVSVLFPPDLLARVDALRGVEGRGPWVRRLVEQAVGQQRPPEEYNGYTFEGSDTLAPERPLKSTRLSVRLNREEADAVQAAAEQMGLPATSWVRQLVRRKLRIYRPYRHEVVEALSALRFQIRKIGLNMNQATKAMRYAKTSGNAPDVLREARRLSEMAEEIAALAAGVGQAAKGDYDYWDIP